MLKSVQPVLCAYFMQYACHEGLWVWRLKNISSIPIFPQHETIPIHMFKVEKLSIDILLSYLWPITFIRLKFTINTHRSTLHLMINYEIIIEEFLLGTNKLHGLVEIWPMDILKWKIYDPIIFESRGLRGLDCLDLQLPVQSVPITTKVVSSNPTQTRYAWCNIMW